MPRDRRHNTQAGRWQNPNIPSAPNRSTRWRGELRPVMRRLRDRVFAPGTEKRLDLRFNVRTAAEMVGRTEKAIRDAEGDGRLPEPEKDAGTGRRTGYSLAEVNRMREVFGTLPHRAPERPADGAGGAELQGRRREIHGGRFTWRSSWRSRATASAWSIATARPSAPRVFGLNPDVDVDEEEDTLYPFFRHGGPSDLQLRAARDLLARHRADPGEPWSVRRRIRIRRPHGARAGLRAGPAARRHRHHLGPVRRHPPGPAAGARA